MPQRWVTTRGTISAIAALDPQAADAVFGTPTAIALGGWPGSTHGMAWASHAKFAADVAAGVVPDAVRAVMYDPEAWEATPLAEKQDPVKYMQEFARLARERGYFVIITPHPRLVEVPGARCRRHVWETVEAAYLRCRIAAEAATHA